MGNEWGGYAMFESNLERRIEMSQAIMERIDGKEPLSSVLSQVKSLAGLNDNEELALIIDVLTFGLGNLPNDWETLDIDSRERSISKIKDLLEVQDHSTLTVESMLATYRTQQPSPKTPSSPKYLHIPFSLFEMEAVKEPLDPLPSMRTEDVNLYLRIGASYKDYQQAMFKCRAFLYDYASQTWQECTRERNRLKLLGPDYRIVLNSLTALDTEVGDDLLAALDRLGSENPANWKLSALSCRNVVLSLGRNLWQASLDDYPSTLLGKTLIMKGQMEKNRISAYIDVYWKGATPSNQTTLQQAHGLVEPIYQPGHKRTHSNAPRESPKVPRGA